MAESILHPDAVRKLGRRVLEIERDALQALLPRIDDSFVAACELCLACTGRVVVLGMGKSGHIAGKIAATLASTGTPAFFVHPGEASHGDLGMITRTDVVLALSNSGETAEVTSLLPVIKRQGVGLIAMTGKPESTLARSADVHLNVAVGAEACPLNLAPTASTTAALAMGDALAVALLEARGFTEEDFALSHPGGSLGRRLLLKIDDLLHSGDAIPRVQTGTPLKEALVEMSAKGLGMTIVEDASGALVGVYTDGDLRRTLDADIDLRSAKIEAVMAPSPKTISTGVLAAEAVKRMQDAAITSLVVTNDAGQVAGILHMHDLLRAGVV
ncbi:KpsF/GutQ family sugar-phosphate isomerase [bacterium]|nr:KpsF/GutQ family sugar-phosphate isomerase [bacterium]